MFHLAAIISFVLALVFYQFHVASDSWSYISWTLLGLILWCVSEHYDRKVPW